MITRKLHNRIKSKIYRQRFNNSFVLQVRRGRKLFPFHTLIRTIPRLTLCEEIIGIQPLVGPTGTVYHLNIIKHN